VGSYDDVKSQISTEISVGNQPNIAYCYPDHVALYNVAQAVVQLDNLIASDITVAHEDGTTEVLGLTADQKNDFIKGYYDEGAQFGDGHMYSMPFSKSTEVLYFNKTFFETNRATLEGKGVKMPGDSETPLTWDELEALCRAIKEIDPNCIPLGYDSEANWFITMCEQLGSPYTSADEENHFLFDNDTNKAFVKRFREWHKAGLVTTQEIYGGYTSGLFTAKDGVKSYMSIGSSAGATHQRPAKGADNTYPFEVGIAPIPQVNQKKAKVISQGPSLCLFKGQNPQETLAAWLLMRFFTTNVAFQAEFSRASGYVPVLQSVAEVPTYKALLDKADGGDNVAFLSAKVCLEQVDNYYTSPAFVGSSKAREEVGNIIVKVLGADPNADDDQIIDEAFRTAIEECEYSI
jgi:multiple sugar transport system substrate-binding protein